MIRWISRHLIRGNLLGLSSLCLLLAIDALSASGNFQNNVASLEPGAPINREMKGGETHLFQIHLNAGQFLYAVVDQKGIDVAVTTRGPDGKQMAKTDSPNSAYGAEPIAVVAEASGDYRIEVNAPNKQAPLGKYTIRIIAVRETTPTDRDHVAAEKAFEEADRMRSQRTAATWRAAIEKYQQAMPFYQSSGDRDRQALTFYIIGNCYANLGEFRTALEYLNQALPLFQALEDQRMQATALNFIGGAWDALSDFARALGYYSQALSLAQITGNRSTESSIFNNIGKIYVDLADWQKAVDNYTKALLLFRDLKDQRREAIALDNIGDAWYLLGDLEKAQEFHQKALPLRRTINDKAGEARTLQRIGVVYAAQGDRPKALENYYLALPLHRAAGDRSEEAATLNHMGEALAALGQYEKAMESLQQSLQLRRTLEDRRGEALTLGSMGRVYTSMGQPQKAIEHHQPALTIFHNIGDRHNEAKMLLGIARAEHDRGNLLAARQQIEAAIPLFEKVRASSSSQQDRASYFALQQNAYQLYIDLLMRLHRQAPAAGYDALALQASERARARSLLEMLAEAHADIRRGVDASLLERERNLMQQLDAKAERLMPLVGRQSAQAQIEALNKEILQLEIDYQQVQAKIREGNPHYAAIVQPEPLDLKGIQEQLAESETMLLEYSLGEERSYLWAVTRDSLTSFELPKEEQIKQATKNVLALLTVRSQSPKTETPPQKRARLAEAEAQLPAAARQLSQMLLGPVAAQIGNKRLVIVADGALQYLPFAMLPVPVVSEKNSAHQPPTTDRRPLIVEHEMISLPSASTLAVQRKELAGRQPAPKMLAVIADPVFDAQDARMKDPRITSAAKQTAVASPSPAETDSTRIIEHLAEKSANISAGKLIIPRLPFTRQEAEQILAIAPGSANLKAVDFKASRATATSAELGQYRYLHFATHGYLDSERRGLSALVLSLVDAQGNAQDGFLRAQEIYNLNLPAELVVLSACQTGLGKEIKGEGLVGVTRGFMYAGAARVVFSLWSVNDKATAELMTKFYQKMLKDGQSPAAALRAAQVEMWQQKQWQAPFYWAAFVLQGEWR